MRRICFVRSVPIHGQIFKGAKPADPSVGEASKFQFAINRAYGIEVPPGLIANADEVIE